MTAKILLVLFAGIGTGIFLLEPEFMAKTDILLDIGLCLLLFFVGIDIGSNKKAFIHLKKIGFKLLLIPISAAIGSILGGMMVSVFIGMNIFEGGAVGAGFGWYSLSAILIAPYSSELSTIAFLTNVFREILAIIFIPITAKYIGYFETIALGGATAMDTTLPIITRNTNSETAVVSFVSGLLMSIFVPILVPLFIALI
ncbi:MAG: lysine exporter LysO family protein [Eubacteriales bacterium]